ncbi:MAG: hypothetical protein ACI93G_002027 [Hyphomonas sp.]|jgi:hypothetical protein
MTVEILTDAAQPDTHPLLVFGCVLDGTGGCRMIEW